MKEVGLPELLVLFWLICVAITLISPLRYIWFYVVWFAMLGITSFTLTSAPPARLDRILFLATGGALIVPVAIRIITSLVFRLVQGGSGQNERTASLNSPAWQWVFTGTLAGFCSVLTAFSIFSTVEPVWLAYAAVSAIMFRHWRYSPGVGKLIGHLRPFVSLP
jgi:hypothetical protein